MTWLDWLDLVVMNDEVKLLYVFQQLELTKAGSPCQSSQCNMPYAVSITIQIVTHPPSSHQLGKTLFMVSRLVSGLCGYKYDSAVYYCTYRVCGMM
jgi:hypothetical protein